jgi:hypothetical protein
VDSQQTSGAYAEFIHLYKSHFTMDRFTLGISNLCGDYLPPIWHVRLSGCQVIYSGSYFSTSFAHISQLASSVGNRDMLGTVSRNFFITIPRAARDVFLTICRMHTLVVALF